MLNSQSVLRNDVTSYCFARWVWDLFWVEFLFFFIVLAPGPLGRQSCALTTESHCVTQVQTKMIWYQATMYRTELMMTRWFYQAWLRTTHKVLPAFPLFLPSMIADYTQGPTSPAFPCFYQAWVRTTQGPTTPAFPCRLLALLLIPKRATHSSRW